MRSRRAPAIPLALLALVAGPGVPDVGAVSGGVVALPVPPNGGSPVYAQPSGLRIEVDSTWFEAGGVRPLRVRLETDNPAPKPRRLLLRFAFSDSGRPEDEDLVVEQEVRLPAGESSAEMIVRVPAVGAWNAFRWSAFSVGGRPEPQLSLQPGQAVPLGNPGGEGFLRLVRPYVPAPGMSAARRVENLTVGENRRLMFERLRVAGLDEWADLSGAETVSLSLDDLRDLVRERPEESDAVRRWVLTGGVLWVEEAGGEAEALREIDTLLGLRQWRMTSTDEAPDGEKRAEADKEAEGEKAAAESEAATPPADANAATQEKPRAVPVEGAAGWGYRFVPSRRPSEGPSEERRAWTLRGLYDRAPTVSRGWFAQREAGFGRVIAFVALPFDVPIALQAGPARDILGEWQSARWASRHGVDPAGAGSPEFGNLLIPGVGTAPVGEFQVLITLFVLAVGPLNYWLLWRRQQLHLLVLTAPLGALAATLGLVGYAAVADGFGVKARVHSVTMLDQATGDAASWSRVSHFVATSPPDPPRIPADAVYYPVAPGWESAFVPDQPQRVARWRDADGGGPRVQELTSGWIPSRTTVQHVVVRCRRSPARLEFADREATANGELSVSNRLGVAVDLLVARDAAGGWSQAESLAAGASTTLRPVDRLDAMRAFRGEAIANVPTFPDGAGKAVEDALQRLGGAGALRALQRSLATVRLSDNLGVKALDALTGLDGGRSLDVPPRTYVAIAREAVETPLGWDEVQEVGSFHVVVGRW